MVGTERHKHRSVRAGSVYEHGAAYRPLPDSCYQCRTPERQRIKTAWLAFGYESAPAACAAATNVRVGLLVGFTNQARNYTATGAEVSLLRWYDGIGYYGVRASALMGSGNRFASLGVRLNTTAALSLGLDAVWTKDGPSEFGSRTGGEPAFGVQASVGFNGGVGAILAGVAVLAGLAFASGQE